LHLHPTVIERPHSNLYKMAHLFCTIPCRRRRIYFAAIIPFSGRTGFVNCQTRYGHLDREWQRVRQEPSPCELTIIVCRSEQIMQAMAVCGFSIDTMGQVFGSLPAGFQRLINDVLQAKSHLATARAVSVRTHVAMPKIVQECMLHDASVGEVSDRSGIGYQCMTFDPSTGQRTKVEINNFFAKLYGLHPEELLARAGNADAQIPMSQLDFLCTMMEEMCGAKLEMRSSKTRYFRFLPQCSGRVKDPLIVRRKNESIYNEAGALLRKQSFYTVVTEEEFDAAKLTNPAICRPISVAIGDNRSAAGILASAHRDFL